MLRVDLVFLLSAAVTSDPLPAQDASGSLLEPTRYGVIYDVPETQDVTVEAGVPYLEDAHGRLTLDVFLPPDATAKEKRPAVVFLNAIGDPPDPAAPKLKSWGIYRTWPRLIAAHGIVGVSMECDATRVQECLAATFRFLAQHGAEHGIDGERLGVYAASANVTGASEYLFGPRAEAGIHAAVLYYGAPPQAVPRRDLPVLFVVAESDVPRLGEPLALLWRRVVEARAPWSLVFGSGMPHAFDAFADDDAARRLVQQTIAFWKSNLEEVPQPDADPEPARAILAALFGNDTRTAVELLKAFVADHPDDAQGWLQYGRALAESSRFPEAGTAYERARALGDQSPPLLAGLGLIRAGESRFEEAADLLGRAAAAGMRDSRVLGALGHAQLMLGRVEAGVRSYEQAFEVGIPPGAQTRGLACFNLACGYARLDQKDQAFEKLGAAIDEGFRTRNAYESDTDLASLRGDPRFVALIARLPAR